MLADIITKQRSYLKILKLGENYFSSSGTEKILKKMAECGVFSSLEEIDLNKSAKFDSELSV